MNILATLKSKLAFVTLLVLMLTVFKVYIFSSSHFFLNPHLQFTGKQNLRWNDTTLNYYKDQTKQRITEKYLRPEVVNREYPSPQLVNQKYPNPQMPTREYPSPQLPSGEYSNPLNKSSKNASPQIPDTKYSNPQIETSKNSSRQLVINEYSNPQRETSKNSSGQLAINEYSNPQIETKKDLSPTSHTRNINEYTNQQIATGESPQIAIKEYNEVDKPKQPIQREKASDKYVNKEYFPPKNSSIQLAIYKYIKTITRIKKKLYLELLWKTLNSQNFTDDIISDMKQDSFPCVIPEKLRIRYEPLSSKSKATNAISILITASPLGRLGNVMGEYATLYALGKLYNVSVFLQPKMKALLGTTFPHISMKELPAEIEKNSCTQLSYDDDDGLVYNYSPIEIAAAGLFGPGCFILKGYPFEMRLFQAVKEDLLSHEFRFSPGILKKVEEFLLSVKQSVQKTNKASVENFDPTFISVHVRRTDYKKHFKNLFGGQLSDTAYLTKALAVAREKYVNPIFIAASDDKKYLKQNFGSEKNFYITPDGFTPGVDMATMSSCNHSIFTVGSFGFWGSFLTGGDVYYADFVRRKPYRFSTQFYQEAKFTNFFPLRAYS